MFYLYKMQKKKLQININTRILLYFLFVTILPLAILALSSTFLIQYSLNEKSEQELSDKIEALQTQYYKIFNNYKNIVTTDSYIKLHTLILENKTFSISKTLLKIKETHQLNFVILFDENLTIKKTISDTNTLILYPLKEERSGIKEMFIAASEGSLPVATEVLTAKQLKLMGLNNKLVLKQDNNNKINYGLLAQIAILPVYKKNIGKYLHNTEELEINNNNQNTPNNKKVQPETKDSQNLKPIGYLLIGNFINSNEDLSRILKDLPNIPVNIMQSNIIVSSNANIPFDLSSLEINKTQKIFSSQNYKGEQFVNNQWYRIATEPIKNYNSDTIALIIVGLEEDIFRSLKNKNSLLMLQVAVLIAAGGLILAFLFTKNITDPISKMITAVRSIESGNLAYTLEVPTEDELGELALSINQMAEALEARKTEILNYNKILLDQKTKLETIFNYSADGIMTLDNDKKITSINSAIIKWTDLETKDILGKYFYDIINFKNDPTVTFTSSIRIEDISDLTVVNKYYPSAQINNIEVEISYSPIKLEKEPLMSYVLILRDVTKRKETEELRENFIATLTHDLRVPLLAEVHTLEYLLKGSYGELSEKQKYITEQLISSNQELLRMVNTLLDTYSYEAGKQSLVKREINLNKLIQESINELKYLAEDKKHTIIFEDSSSTYMITADKQELKRVIVNLLSNAIIHTPENGTIEFILTTQESFAVVSIKDNGVGLSEKDKEIVFQRFARGGKTLRKVGTGLGLYLSKHIIELHGGKIWVESKLQEGSTFSFSIPLPKKEMESTQHDQVENTAN